MHFYYYNDVSQLINRMNGTSSNNNNESEVILFKFYANYNLIKIFFFCFSIS